MQHDQSEKDLREALDDIWGCIAKPEIDALQPETVQVAQANHELLWHSGIGMPIVHEDGDSLEHYVFAAMLRRMYSRYLEHHPDADLFGEAGIHRLVFRTPFDGRRQTTFARVGDGNAFVRHYILHPYTSAKNGTADDVREVEDVYAVLSGERLGEMLITAPEIPYD